MAQYEWDPDKAAANYRKHGVHFADAVGVFEDDDAITIEDTSTEEQRCKTLAVDFLGRLLVVVYTYRDDRIRLISARIGTAPQRDLYDRRHR
ncbi:MAG TPA: BrnT family toxin [Thermoanaerobaculia bacterium]|nr:BrnT family toxin [Thermoanaerobaculia bacterium]